MQQNQTIAAYDEELRPREAAQVTCNQAGFCGRLRTESDRPVYALLVIRTSLSIMQTPRLRC